MNELMTQDQIAEETFRQYMAKWTPEKRRVAIVRYDPNWVKSLAQTDPLFLSLVSLHAELTSPFSDVELRAREIAEREMTLAYKSATEVL